MTDVERIIERAVNDADFRSDLLADPVGTVQKNGYAVSEETLSALQAMDAAEMAVLADELDERLAKNKCCYTCGGGNTVT